MHMQACVCLRHVCSRSNTVVSSHRNSIFQNVQRGLSRHECKLVDAVGSRMQLFIKSVQTCVTSAGCILNGRMYPRASIFTQELCLDLENYNVKKCSVKSL